MITIFNREIIASTPSLASIEELKGKLIQAGIPFSITASDNNGSPFFASRKATLGTFGENKKLLTQYKLYVKKSDYEKAIYKINNRD